MQVVFKSINKILDYLLGLMRTDYHITLVSGMFFIDRLSLSWAITVFSLGPDPTQTQTHTQTRPADPEMIIQNWSDSSSQLYWF